MVEAIRVLPLLVFALTGSLRADEPGKFLGAQSCSSSSCHGGAAPDKNQNLIWSQHDFHARSFATLTTARSERMAEFLKIENAAKDNRCTSCHAPFHEVAAELLSKEIRVSDGVSCENCHGPAEKWLRSHTRKDFSHEDRVNAGLRDLKNLYGRANTCVACHQNVSSDLRKAGHPELIFELDGQTVSEPKHWREAKNFSGAQAWLVGQAAALREMSWQLAREKTPDEDLVNRWRGLVWLMDKTCVVEPSWPTPAQGTFKANPENYERIQKWSDALAKAAAKISWTQDLSRRVLVALSQTSDAFADKIPQAVQARRAERLVLALDRLTLAIGEKKSADAELNRLFALAQSIPDFDSTGFSEALKQFAQTTNLPGR